MSAEMRYASEPAIVDLDGDNYYEVIVGVWNQKGSATNGQLLILNFAGFHFFFFYSECCVCVWVCCV